MISNRLIEFLLNVLSHRKGFRRYQSDEDDEGGVVEVLADVGGVDGVFCVVDGQPGVFGPVPFDDQTFLHQLDDLQDDFAPETFIVEFHHAAQSLLLALEMIYKNNKYKNSLAA